MTDNVDGAGVPAGWYPDPADSASERRWDGANWTDDVRPVEAAAESEAESRVEPEVEPGVDPAVSDSPSRPRISGWGSLDDSTFAGDGDEGMPSWMNLPGITLPPDLSSLSAAGDASDFPSRPSFDDSSIDTLSTAPPVFGKPVFQDEPTRAPEQETAFDSPPRQSPVPFTAGPALDQPVFTDPETQPDPAVLPEPEHEPAVPPEPEPEPERKPEPEPAHGPKLEPEVAPVTDPETEPAPEAAALPREFTSRRARRAAVPVEIADDEQAAAAEAAAAATSVPSAPYAPPPAGVQYIAPLPPGVANVEPTPDAVPASRLGSQIAPRWAGSDTSTATEAAAAAAPSAGAGASATSARTAPAEPPHFDPLPRTVVPLGLPLPTRSSTLGVWLIALLPLMQFGIIYYLFEVLSMPVEPGLKWGIVAAPGILSVIFAALDRRRLLADGFERVPALIWGLIPPLYLLIRCFKVGPRSISALLLWVLFQVAAVIGVYILLPSVLAQTLGNATSPLPIPSGTADPVLPSLTAAERSTQLTVKGMQAKILTDNHDVFQVRSVKCPALKSKATGSTIVCAATLVGGSKLMLTERVDNSARYVAFVQVASKPA